MREIKLVEFIHNLWMTIQFHFVFVKKLFKSSLPVNIYLCETGFLLLGGLRVIKTSIERV